MAGRIRRGPDSPMWGKHLSDKAKQRLREAALLRPPVSREVREKLSRAGQGRKHTPVTKQKMAETRRKIWADPAFREKVRGVLPAWTAKKPNGIESSFMSLVSGLGNIEYVGNGRWWRLLPGGARKNPDFKVRGENKVIEVFGDYWHQDENPDALINQYRGAGIDCLVIWEHEIRNAPQGVAERVSRFIGN
jgi:hypothetical protein